MKKLWIGFLTALLLCCTLITPAFAATTESEKDDGVEIITEDEVREQVEANGKESVTGNVFIWFLCAVAFLKASQKIDSFMSSLGVNVGHTGGSLLAEAMIATRGLTALKGGISGRFSGGSGKTSGSTGKTPSGTGFAAGGLAGVVGRSVFRSAASSVTNTEKTGSGGSIGRMMFEKSLEKNGSFAQSVTSSIAMGNISTDGTMTGETAKNAFAAYMGYDSGAMPHNTAPPSGPITSPTASGVNVTKTGTPGTVSAGGTGSVGGPPSAGTVNPTFSNIEIGGGRITGIETPPDSSTGTQFAMYSVDQYSQPSGDYSIVSAVDGSKWYKQYAKPVVDKTPYMADNGEIQYREKIIQRLPKANPRKEKL